MPPRPDASLRVAQRRWLQRIGTAPMAANSKLHERHEQLLFLAAHPADAQTLRRVMTELRRIERWLRQLPRPHPPTLTNHGLPFVDTVSRFSHDCLRWLLTHPQLRVAIDDYVDASFDLSAVLRLTLPAVERGPTTAGLGNDELLDALGVAPSRRLHFIVEQLATLDAQPYVKDTLFDALGLYVRLTPTRRDFSKAANRLPTAQPFFHDELLKRFDHLALLERKLPRPRVLDDAALAQAVLLLKNTMALTARETDPATYLDPSSLRLFDLERGISVAIFGMQPARQLPLESYVGFTLFKNGLPAAYGGAWPFGARAEFGMNIFEPYRGGESGFMMCQLLRVYRQAFGLRRIEVDGYQFGRDNPEGIASGAFWFYYRYGFRPIDKSLAALAEREQHKIATRPGYRTSEKTLQRLAESNMALSFGGREPPRLADLAARITRLIQRRFGGDRQRALASCIAEFQAQVRLPRRLDGDEQRVLAEVALVAAVLAVDDQRRLRLLAQMVRTKPRDVQRYQRLWLRFFESA